MSGSARNKKLDFVRGFAAVIVVWGHVIQYAIGGVSFADDNLIYRIIYSFHMPLFMWLCGFNAVNSSNKMEISGGATLLSVYSNY